MTETMQNSLIPASIDGQLQPVDKLEVHRRGLRHPAVSVFVLRGDMILMQQRAQTKYHTPGLWTNTCCTHPHWQEPPQTCALRRLDEELGLTGLTLRGVGVVEYRAAVPTADGAALTEHEVVDIFVGSAPEDVALRLDPAEVMAVRWMSLDALQSDIERNPQSYTPWLRIYLENHRQMIFGDACTV